MELGNNYACRYSEKKLEIKKEIHYPHSLGLLYSAFTYYTDLDIIESIS